MWKDLLHSNLAHFYLSIIWYEHRFPAALVHGTYLRSNLLIVMGTMPGSVLCGVFFGIRQGRVGSGGVDLNPFLAPPWVPSSSLLSIHKKPYIARRNFNCSFIFWRRGHSGHKLYSADPVSAVLGPELLFVGPSGGGAAAAVLITPSELWVFFLFRSIGPLGQY